MTLNDMIPRAVYNGKEFLSFGELNTELKRTLESFEECRGVPFDARKAPIGSLVRVKEPSDLDFAGETGQIANIDGDVVEVIFGGGRKTGKYYYAHLKQGYPAEAYNPKKRKDETKMTSIKRVIFQAPATIVFWADGTKTVVKCSKNDTYDAEKGLAMAVLKKYWGKGYYNRMKKLLPEEKAKASETAAKTSEDNADDCE